MNLSRLGKCVRNLSYLCVCVLLLNSLLHLHAIVSLDPPGWRNSNLISCGSFWNYNKKFLQLSKEMTHYFLHCFFSQKIYLNHFRSDESFIPVWCFVWSWCGVAPCWPAHFCASFVRCIRWSLLAISFAGTTASFACRKARDWKKKTKLKNTHLFISLEQIWISHCQKIAWQRKIN